MQAPGHVGIFGRIFGRPVERDLAERYRLLAGAANLLERNAFMTEMTAGQLVHPVSAADPLTRTPGVEIEADHHRVVERGDCDTVAREHVEIVFAIMGDFKDRIVLQQRFEQRECFAGRDLVGFLVEHVRSAMGERDVAGLVRAHGEAHPDQLRAHRIERAGFGIEGDQPRCPGALDPFLQRANILHGFILRAIAGRQFGRRLAIALAVLARLGTVGLGRGRGFEPFAQARKAMQFEEFGQRFARDSVELHLVERLGEVAILLQRHQHPAQFGHIAPFEHALLELALFHLGRGVERALQ